MDIEKPKEEEPLPEGVTAVTVSCGTHSASESRLPRCF